MRSAYGCAGLGLLLLLVAGTFDAEPLYVTGSALALLGLGAAGWSGAGAWGAKIERELGTRSVLEEQPLAVVITASSGSLPLPPGWIDEPLLPDPVRFQAGRRTTRVRVEIRFGRRGRRKLAPPALVLRDPFGLAQRVVTGGEPDELLVLPRILPVTGVAINREEGRPRAGHPADEGIGRDQRLERRADLGVPGEDRRLEIVARHPGDVSPAGEGIEVERQRTASPGRFPRGIHPAVRLPTRDRNRR